MITEDKIDEATTALRKAADQVAEFDAVGETPDNWRAVRHARAVLATAGERLDRLQAQRRYAEHAGAADAAARAEADRAKTVHTRAEKTYGKDLRELQRSLVESRARIASTSNTAAQALSAVLEAGETHDQLVRRHAAILVERGMTVLDDEWKNGGTAGGCVRLNDMWWLPVDPRALFMRAAHAAALRHYGYRDNLVRRVAHFIGVDRLDGRQDELVKDAPVPNPHHMPDTAGYLQATAGVLTAGHTIIAPTDERPGYEPGNRKAK